MGTPSSAYPGVVVFDHPLIQHKLTYLRDKSVSHRPFRALLYQIAGLMVFEVTRTLPTEVVEVDTPIERTTGRRLKGLHHRCPDPALRPGHGGGNS